MIGIQFHRTSSSQSCAQVVVILIVCARMSCFRMIRTIMVVWLARGAQIGKTSQVADFCAGLGGTVRYLAHKYGANVTGIELTPSRVAGAQQLTKLVGLQEKARVIEGSVMSVPLDDATMNAVVSQESFCHVPDPKKALSEACRVLKQDGRLAFTDWIA